MGFGCIASMCIILALSVSWVLSNGEGNNMAPYSVVWYLHMAWTIPSRLNNPNNYQQDHKQFICCGVVCGIHTLTIPADNYAMIHLHESVWLMVPSNLWLARKWQYQLEQFGRITSGLQASGSLLMQFLSTPGYQAVLWYQVLRSDYITSDR